MATCKRCGAPIGPRTKNGLCRPCTADLFIWRHANGKTKVRQSRVTDDMIVAAINAGASDTKTLLAALDWRDHKQLYARVRRLVEEGRCGATYHNRPRGFEYFPVDVPKGD